MLNLRMCDKVLQGIHNRGDGGFIICPQQTGTIRHQQVITDIIFQFWKFTFAQINF